jgi:hypothetical protein
MMRDTGNHALLNVLLTFFNSRAGSFGENSCVILS